jgi:hypothetical protein
MNQNQQLYTQEKVMLSRRQSRIINCILLFSPPHPTSSTSSQLIPISSSRFFLLVPWRLIIQNKQPNERSQARLSSVNFTGTNENLKVGPQQVQFVHILDKARVQRLHSTKKLWRKFGHVILHIQVLLNLGTKTKWSKVDIFGTCHNNNAVLPHVDICMIQLQYDKKKNFCELLCST